MNWKRVIARLLVLTMACGMLTFTGCKSEETEEKETVSEETEKTAENEKGYYTAEDYLADPTLFTPVWADEWQPPEEMLDFEEKWESFFIPDGRLMSLIHRGDNNIYYPENSIEGIMSCIMAGADMLELDVVMTKDGVAMMMHDDTLTRTTNVAEMRKSGAQGLPESDYISEWTFEQVRRLRLTMNGEATNYVVPTLEEVIMVCNNRCFIFLDLAGEHEFDWLTELYPLVQKHNAYRTVWLPHGYLSSLTMNRVDYLLDMIEQDSGYKPAVQAGVNESNIEGMVQMIEDYDLPRALRGSEYDTDTYDWFGPYVGEYRCHVNCLYSPNNVRSVWEMVYEQGFNFIQVDDYIELEQYIEELHFQE